VWEQFLMQQRFMVIGYALVAGVLLVHQAAHAGRPMEVDDAGIVDYRSCHWRRGASIVKPVMDIG